MAQTKFMRMVIVEALSEEQADAVIEIYKTLDISDSTGFLNSEILREEGGNMVVASTLWASREDCLRYHSSRSYRQYVTKTAHLLAGNPVVKIFQQETVQIGVTA